MPINIPGSPPFFDYGLSQDSAMAPTPPPVPGPSARTSSVVEQGVMVSKEWAASGLPARLEDHVQNQLETAAWEYAAQKRGKDRKTFVDSFLDGLAPPGANAEQLKERSRVANDAGLEWDKQAEPFVKDWLTLPDHALARKEVKEKAETVWNTLATAHMAALAGNAQTGRASSSVAPQSGTVSREATLRKLADERKVFDLAFGAAAPAPAAPDLVAPLDAASDPASVAPPQPEMESRGRRRSATRSPDDPREHQRPRIEKSEPAPLPQELKPVAEAYPRSSKETDAEYAVRLNKDSQLKQPKALVNGQPLTIEQISSLSNVPLDVLSGDFRFKPMPPELVRVGREFPRERKEQAGAYVKRLHEASQQNQPNARVNGEPLNPEQLSQLSGVQIDRVVNILDSNEKFTLACRRTENENTWESDVRGISWIKRDKAWAVNLNGVKPRHFYTDAGKDDEHVKATHEEAKAYITDHGGKIEKNEKAVTREWLAGFTPAPGP